jgi:predicted transcriptional regulator/Flp pilus assembly pilin Flp
MKPGSRRFGLRRRGATLVEYASMMAIGAAVLAGGALALGEFTNNSFQTAARSFPNQSFVVVEETEPSVSLAAESIEAAPIIPWWGATILLGIGAVGLVYVNRPKAKVKRQLEEPESEPLPVVPQRLEAQFIAKRQQILQVLDRELWCVFDGRIIVQDILTECPTTVRPDATRERVQATLESEHIHQVLVVDMQGQLQGVVSDRDCLTSKGKTAAEMMQRSPETVAKTLPVTSAISLMLDRRISSLPVVEEGRVVGIVTSSDMLMTLQCCIQLLQRLANTMWQPGLPAKSWDEDSLPAASADAPAGGTGRFYDVMKVMSESQT